MKMKVNKSTYDSINHRQIIILWFWLLQIPVLLQLPQRPLCLPTTKSTKITLLSYDRPCHASILICYLFRPMLTCLIPTRKVGEWWIRKIKITNRPMTTWIMSPTLVPKHSTITSSSTICTHSSSTPANPSNSNNSYTTTSNVFPTKSSPSELKKAS